MFSKYFNSSNNKIAEKCVNFSENKFYNNITYKINDNIMEVYGYPIDQKDKDLLKIFEIELKLLTKLKIYNGSYIIDTNGYCIINDICTIISNNQIFKLKNINQNLINLLEQISNKNIFKNYSFLENVNNFIINHPDIDKLECPICLELIHDNMYVHVDKHFFHKKCLETWLKKENLCPVCRQFGSKKNKKKSKVFKKRSLKKSKSIIK